MPRPSTIDRLPPEIREEIGRLRTRGRTIDEILGKLRELDVDVSRSALGRHVKQLDQIGEELRRSRAIAEQLVERLGDAPESRTARLNIELMHSLVLKCLVGEDGAVVELDGKEAMFIATALQKLAQASKQDVEREQKIREAVKAEIAARAASTAKDAGSEMKRAGLSAATIEKIETEILGIVR